MKPRNLMASLAMAGILAATAIAQTKIEKVPVKYTAPASGAGMFAEYCATCHGTSGKGNGPAAAALKKAPADLTQLTAKNGGKFPDTRITQYISGDDTVAAHGSRDMPVWGKLFHSVDNDNGVVMLRISNLSDYIKTLQAK